MENVKIMVDEIFEKEPESMVVITENRKPIAIAYKEDWEGEKLTHVKAKCKEFIPPSYITRSDIPIIGTVLYVELKECEECG